MKNKKTTLALLYSLAVLLTAVNYSCSKKRIEEEERTLNEYNSPNDYFDSKKQQEQEFVINSDSSSNPIQGNQGTNVWPGRQCLMYPNGDTVALPYIVKLVELYTPKDMIYYRMPTVAGDTILETGGEIRLRAFKDGTELMLRPGCSWPIKMPNSAPANYMRVFYGFNSSNYVDWTDNPTTLGVTTSYIPTFAAATGGYLGATVRLGWINCDVRRGAPVNHHLSFVSSTDNLTNVAIFVYFPATKTVMQVYNMTSGSIPDNSSVKIIAVGVDNSGTLFSFSQNMTVTASSSIEVTMAATTDPALTAALDGL
ncbi:MAG: hypothetical protein WAQ28_03115 [Bacteroidia bacterium]